MTSALDTQGDLILNPRAYLLLVSLPWSPKVRAEPKPETSAIEVVCAHAMAQTMDRHEDQFLAEVRADIGEDPEMAWMVESTRAQWIAELERQCIESLIPIRRSLIESEKDSAYAGFSRCVLTTTMLDQMEACFSQLNTDLTATPIGSAARASMQVNQIREALLKYGVVTGSYLPIPAFVPNDPPGTEPRPWPEGSPFQVIPWSPEDGQAWGSYRVELVGKDDFKVIGTMDIDGDGVPAVWTATKRLEATLQTDPSIH